MRLPCHPPPEEITAATAAYILAKNALTDAKNAAQAQINADLAIALALIELARAACKALLSQ